MIRILAGISLGLAIFGYFDQAIRLHEPWEWSRFWHHESLIAMYLVASVSLIVGKYLRRRNEKD